MNIYALLVAVSEYPDGISNLPGCKEDLTAINAFFQEYTDRNGVKYKVKKLLNQTATRQGLIEGFRHFDAAGSDDICIFYYSGHGAQMPAPPEFWDQETDRKCETMVLSDSRLPGGRDLADKELSYLLATHTEKAGQVLVIADSCHSGTISREAAVVPRTVADNSTRVSYQDFHGAEHYLEAGEYRRPPVRPHVALSACRPEQLAMEMPMQGTRHGLFTWFLIETMNGVDLASLSYAELMDRVNVRVKNRYRKQDVYAMAVGGANMSQLFLNGQLKLNRTFLLHHEKDVGWYVDRGEVNGISAGAKGVAMTGEEERNFTVSEVIAGRSFVRPESWMATDKAPYSMVSLTAMSRRMPVYLDPSLGPIPTTILTTQIKRQKDTLLLTDDKDSASYHVKLLPTYGVSMTLPKYQREKGQEGAEHAQELPEAGERPLFKSVPKTVKGWGVKFVQDLSKVSTYENVLQLAPATNSLDVEEKVEIKLEQVFLRGTKESAPAEDKALDGTAVFPYTRNHKGVLKAPKLRLSIRRKPTAGGSLHVGMLYLNEIFGVTGQYLPVKELTKHDVDAYHTSSTVEDVKNDKTYDFSFFEISLPDVLQDWGLTEISNYLKVIVSETKFDLSKYEQDDLEFQEKLDENNNRGAGRVTLDFDEDDVPRWGVKNIPITIFRPLMAEHGAKAYGQQSAPVSVAAKPAGFSVGDIMLDASLSATRSLAEGSAPACPTEGFCLAPMSLVSSRSAMREETPLDMVQLFGVENEHLVTEKTPLHLKAEMPAEDGCLIFAFDEEARRYYPVGFPDEASGNMIITQLPKPQQEEYTRSLGGSIKLFFRKVVSDYVPWLDGNINLLRKAEITEDNSLNYVSENAKVIAEDVAKDDVKTIAVFIHGIIGDTSTAPLILQRAKMPDGSPVYDQYDLLLTFDYENLKTTLKTTALDFQNKLKEVGLGPGHGKTVHLYSHSMGGLVSRWFIEVLEGKQMVGKFLQFGTPNGGSPYGNAAQWMTPLLSRALAAGAAYNPLLAPLLGLRWFVNTALATLKEMKVGSEFLVELKKSGVRGDVPYFLINGNIRLIPDKAAAVEATFLRKIMARLNWQDGIDLAFFQQPNDVAVSIKSQQDIPNLTGFSKAVASDHMSYFMDPDSIAVYVSYLPSLFPGMFPGSDENPN